METPFQNDASSQTFVEWMLSSNVSNVWRHSRNLFPDAGSSLLGVCTKEFTSCRFTFFSCCLCSCATNHSEVGSFSFGPWPNSSHQLETAPWILSWFAEWLVRKKSSVSETSALKCMVSLLFFLLRISQTQSTGALEYWVTSFFESFHHLCGCESHFPVCNWEFRNTVCRL